MSWPLVKLHDICRPKQWPTISSAELTDQGYAVYGANGKIGFYNEFTHEYPTVLITCRGATCGRINVSEPRSYVNGNAMALDNLDSRVELRFLYHFLNQRRLDDVISGSAQPQITGEGLRKVEIPLPRLEEQRRIATILDKAEALRAKRRQALSKLDTLAQTLFLEMFGDPAKNPMGWKFMALGDVLIRLTDGTHFSPPIQLSGVPYITPKHLKASGLDFYSAPWYISEADHKEIYERCDPKPGDVLYIKDGATTGLAAINFYEFEFSMLSSLALFRPDPVRITSEYLCAFLNNSRTKSIMLGDMAGAAIRRLTLEKLKRAKVMVPTLKLQQVFSHRMGKIQAAVKRCRSSDTLADNLFASLQYRAFRGEL